MRWGISENLDMADFEMMTNIIAELLSAWREYLKEHGTGQPFETSLIAVKRAIDKGREAVDKGYDTAREYVSKGADYAGEVSDSLTDFVQRQPWLALAGAFVVGYVAAKALRQVSL